MYVDHRRGGAEQARLALSGVVLPIEWLVELPFDALDLARERLVSRHQLLAQNRDLRQRALLLQARQQRVAALQAENARLRRLLRATRRTGESLSVAEIVRLDLDPYRHEVLIDRGTRDGVHRGQALVDAYGIVGQVIHAGIDSASALLITDPNHAVPVEVTRNGLRALAQGTGQGNRLSVPYLPNNADIREGDVLVASGLGGRFPRGYPVAVVTEMRRDPGRRFADIAARPIARVDRSREVLLVWPRPMAAVPAPSSTTAAQAAPAADAAAAPAAPAAP